MVHVSLNCHENNNRPPWSQGTESTESWPGVLAKGRSVLSMSLVLIPALMCTHYSLVLFTQNCTMSTGLISKGPSRYSVGLHAAPVPPTQGSLANVATRYTPRASLVPNVIPSACKRLHDQEND